MICTCAFSTGNTEGQTPQLSNIDFKLQKLSPRKTPAKNNSETVCFLVAICCCVSESSNRPDQRNYAENHNSPKHTKHLDNLVSACLYRHEQHGIKPGMQRHVKWLLHHIRLTEIYRGKTSLLSPFRRVIRTLAMPLLAHCLCWSHPAVRASFCSCYSPSWLPTPELLENYLAK